MPAREVLLFGAGPSLRAPHVAKEAACDSDASCGGASPSGDRALSLRTTLAFDPTPRYAFPYLAPPSSHRLLPDTAPRIQCAGSHVCYPSISVSVGARRSRTIWHMLRLCFSEGSHPRRQIAAESARAVCAADWVLCSAKSPSAFDRASATPWRALCMSGTDHAASAGVGVPPISAEA